MSPRPTSPRRTPLREVAALVGAAAPETDTVLTGATLDSRSVRPGDLYAALPGARVHGAGFGAQAAAAGAAAVLTDAAGRDRLAADGVTLPVVVVDDPRGVLGAVSARVYGTEELPLRIVGITGTNGKTTTAYLVHSALTALGHEVGLIGTVESRIGEERVDSTRTTPEAPDLHALLAVMAERGLDTCVMEVSSHALALHRVDGVRYDVALFTNLSQDHLDFHRDMDDYFAAKASLFTPERARRALVCTDDAWGVRLLDRAGVPAQSLATGPADWSVRPDPADPAAFRLTGPGRRRPRPALEPAGRLQRHEHGDGRRHPRPPRRDARARRPGGARRPARAGPDGAGRRAGPGARPRAVVDYAHTPDAIAAALRALRPTTPGTLVCVTGAGGDRDRDKRHAMGAAAAEVADLVVVTDDNPRSEDPAAIRAAVLEGVEAVRAAGRAVEVTEVGDRRRAIRAAVAAVVAEGPDATVAVVGKGHETGQEVGGVVHPFDDRDELREALRLAAPAVAP